MPVMELYFKEQMVIVLNIVQRLFIGINFRDEYRHAVRPDILEHNMGIPIWKALEPLKEWLSGSDDGNTAINRVYSR
jgi:hypothetical protein